jgi:hypothetical protein
LPDFEVFNQKSLKFSLFLQEVISLSYHNSCFAG